VVLNRDLFGGILVGITAGDWLRTLRENRFAVDLPYWPRAALLTLGSLSNSFYRRNEERACSAAVARSTIKPPLFLLGHWRTGTTHLHNLLAVDSRFAYPNSYQVIYPHTFLSTEAKASRLIAFWVPERRPQDNVRLGLKVPQEDEFALAVMALHSPYLAWVFPRRERHYERYLTFRGVPEPEVRRWKEAFVFFLKKLTWRYDRPLLLKSPPHTGRIRLLLEMLPDARFIHIHRHPYRVFQSTKHTHEKVRPTFALQRWPREDLEEGIIRRYQAMYEAFFEERGLIPNGRFHEMAFEALEKNPLGEMRRVYEVLGLPGFDALHTPMQRYLDSLANYRKNEFPELAFPLRRRIAHAWKRSFEEWGYRAD
jgi:hypothetical protein